MFRSHVCGDLDTHTKKLDCGTSVWVHSLTQERRGRKIVRAAPPPKNNVEQQFLCGILALHTSQGNEQIMCGAAGPHK